MRSQTTCGLLVVLAVLLALNLFFSGTTSARAERTRVGSQVIGFAVTRGESGGDLTLWRLHADGHVEVRRPGAAGAALDGRSAAGDWTPLVAEEPDRPGPAPPP